MDQGIYLITIAIDNAEDGVVGRLALLQLFDPLPQLLFCPPALVNTLGELAVLKLKNFDVHLLLLTGNQKNKQLTHQLSDMKSKECKEQIYCT